MAKILTSNKNYYDIADTIRQMKNVNTTYKPREMASALKDIYSNEVEGTLPLSFEANGEDLLNYRIDCASGGVGEMSENLFNINSPNVEKGCYYDVTGVKQNNIRHDSSEYIPCRSGVTYTLSFYSKKQNYGVFVNLWDLQKQFVSNLYYSGTIRTVNDTINCIFTSNQDGYIKFNFLYDSGYMDNIMLNEGSTALPYEPYGYKVPVVVSGKNLFDELQVVDTTVSSEMSNYQIFKNNGKLLINGLTTSSQSDVEIANINSINNQVLQFINSNEAQYIFSAEVPGRIMIRYKLNGSDVVRYTFDEYNSSNRVADRIVFRLQQNYQYNNEQMNIMFKLKQIQSDNYEPYHEPTTTNIYLDEPIGANANIPSEYEEVEYIESTGTQYIDTNYTPVQGDDLEFKNVTINTFNGALFSAGIESYQLILLGLGSVCYYKYFQIGNAVASSFSTITNGNIKVLNGNLYINNVLKAQADYGGAVNTTLNIFQRANNTSNLIGKIGEIIISNNGIIKRDFIPCYRKSDNVAGLYDLVNSTFYTNQGTGNFIVGPIKANKSISLSDTNTNIPTIDGTNILTIDTTVQPSNVYVQIAKNNVIKNWEEIGYFIEPNIINNSFNYAKQIMQNWDNTLTDYTRKFAGDLNLRIMPLVDTLNGINFSNMFLDCNCLVAIAKLNLSNGVSFNSMFSNCYSLVEVPQLNISKGMSFYCMFSNCYSLTTIPQLNASSGLYFVGIFSSCYCLVNFGGLLNIGQAYETSESSNSYGYELDLSSCWQLTHDSLMNVINKLYDIATKGCNTQQLVLGSTNLAKLSAEEIAIATNKGWSVS